MNKTCTCYNCGSLYQYIKGKWVCPYCGAYKPEELSSEEVTLIYFAEKKLHQEEFSDAENDYTDIIEKYPNNPIGYWGRLLAKYRFKHEEDFNGRKIPTCYATSIESVINDKDYLKALELADKENKELYIREAEYIERVRKEWIEKASKEKPYDIFICYKESDKINGIKRTQDSIAVQDLYIHLSEQGYRVFYSRESLRDKVGEKYEPYIFNALSTAKVMLVYGSSANYITSSWLKNEWHRYLKRIASGNKKENSLLVICDGFSPEELPKALSLKQCLDATERSFYTDLDSAIKKVVSDNNKQELGSVKKYKVEKFNVENLQPAKKIELQTYEELHEHNYKKQVVIPPTCLEQGYTIFRCACGAEKKGDFTPKRVEHDFVLAEEKLPTCINEGYKLYECKFCDATKKEIVKPLGHNYKLVEEKEATCYEDGFKTYQCTTCDNKKVEVVPKVKHKFGDWVVTIQPTCDKQGEKARRCKYCPKTQKRTIDAKGHQFGKWVVKQESTCLEEGIEHRQCKTCGKLEERKIPIRKHEFSAWQNSTDGKHKERVCKHCGKTETILTQEYKNKITAKILTIATYVLFAISLVASLIGLILLIVYGNNNEFITKLPSRPLFSNEKLMLLASSFIVGLISLIFVRIFKKKVAKLTNNSSLFKTSFEKITFIILLLFNISCIIISFISSYDYLVMGENIKRQLIIGLVGGLNFIFAFIGLNKWIEEKYIFEEYKTSAISLLITCLLNVSLAFLLGINYLIIFICFSLIEFVFAIVFTVKAYKDDAMGWYYFLLTQVFVIFFLIFVVLGVTIL